MKKYIALILACLLLLCGCKKNQGGAASVQGQQEPAAAGDVLLAVEPDYGFDPFETTSSSNRLVLEFVLQPLFTVSATGEPVPILAKGWSVSADGMTTTVFLREDVTFHNGTPLTAAAVIDSVEQAKEGSFYAQRFRFLQSVEAQGEHTVIFQTERAYECFPRLLDIPVVLGKNSLPVGTGPYCFQGRYSLKQAAGWQQYPMEAETVKLVSVADTFALRDSFQFGGVAAVMLDPNAMGALGFNGEFALWSVPTSILQYVGFNLNAGPFQNASLRSAVTYAIDRTTIVREDLMGFGTEVPLPALPGSALESPELVQKCVFDPQKLTDAAMTADLTAAMAGLGEPITMIVNTPGSQRARTAQRIADQLELCGIPVKVKALDADAFRKALKNGEYDLYYAEVKLSPDMETVSFFQSEHYGFGGLGQYGNMVALCDLVRANRGNAYDLHNEILSGGLICPVAMKELALYVHGEVLSGVSPHLNGWILG